MKLLVDERIVDWRVVGAIAVCVLMTGSVVVGGGAEAMFKDLYDRDLAAVRATPGHDDDIRLAQRLLTVAEDVKTPPAMIVQLCEHAYALTHTDPATVQLAQHAMQLLAMVPDQGVEAYTHLAELAQAQLLQSRGTQRAGAATTLVETLQQLANAQQQGGQTDAALTTLHRAQAVARQFHIDSDDLTRQLNQVVQRQRVEHAIQQDKQRLAANPNDSEAANHLVTTLIVNKADPVAAAKYAANLTDADLRRHVLDAAKPVDQLEPGSAIDLAQWYQTLATATDAASQRRLLSRSVDALRTAVDHADGVTKTKAKLMLADASLALDKAGGYVEPLATAPGDWIDLLADVDLKRNTINGKWTRKGGDLISGTEQYSRVELPIELLGSYQLSVSFTRDDGNDTAYLIFPVGPSHAGIMFGGFGNTRIMLDGVKHNLPDDQTLIQAGLTTGHRYHAEVLVQYGNEVAHIRVRLDQKVVIDWHGPIDSLSQGGGWQIPDPHMPGLGSWQNHVTFHEARVRMLNGYTRRIERTQRVGGGGGGSFTETPYGPGVLIGIRYRMGNYAGHPIIKSIQPIFLTADGRQLGAVRGSGGDAWREVVAKSGYVVNTVHMRGGDRLDGFDLEFARLTTTGLDTHDVYSSKWQGGRGGGECDLTGRGEPVIGIHGRSGDDVDAFGLVYAPVKDMHQWGRFENPPVTPATANHSDRNQPTQPASPQNPALVHQLPGPSTVSTSTTNWHRTSTPTQTDARGPTFFGIPLDPNKSP